MHVVDRPDRMQLLRSLDLEVLEEKDTATSILDLATVRRSLSDL